MTIEKLAKAMNPVEWTLLLFLSCLWGCSFFFTQIALRDVPPITIVFTRVLTATIVLWCALFVTRQRVPRGWRAWGGLAAMALLNSIIPVSLIAWSQTAIVSSLSAILAASSPVIGVVVAHVMTSNEKLSFRRFAGTMIGFIGVAVIIGPSALGNVGENILPQMAVLIAAASSAFASVFGTKFSQRGVTPLVAATGQVSVSAVIVLPVMLVIDEPWLLAMPSTSTVWALLGLGVLSTALAYLIFFRLLGSAGATNIQLAGYLVPFSATLLGTIVLDEVLVGYQLAGMAVLILGLLIIDGRFLSKRPTTGKHGSQHTATERS